MLANFSPLNACRLCAGREFTTVLDLGPVPLMAWPLPEEPPPPKSPLHLMQCDACNLVQLAHTLDRDQAFRTYWYRSGIGGTMRQHLAALAAECEALLPLQAGDSVLDIGCNDGTFLRALDPKRYDLWGVDPSDVARQSHVDDGHYRLVPDFYGRGHFPVKAKLITSIAMFYDVEDPHAFVEHIVQDLKEDGVWVCEVNDLRSMLFNLTFDIIGHEHLTYWDAETFQRLLRQHGLYIWRMGSSTINGGSARFYIKKGSSSLQLETKGYDLRPHTQAFEWRLSALRDQVQAYFERRHHSWCYGASTRGLTMLPYFGLDCKQFDGVAERNPEKVGRMYGATGIPVRSEDDWRKANPKTTAILPYSFADEFRIRENDYLQRGGTLVLPIPTVKEITA